MNARRQQLYAYIQCMKSYHGKPSIIELLQESFDRDVLIEILIENLTDEQVEHLLNTRDPENEFASKEEKDD